MHESGRDNDKNASTAEVLPAMAAGRRKLLTVGAALLGAPLLAGLSRQTLANPAQTASKSAEATKPLNDFRLAIQDVQILFVDLQQALTQGSQSIAPEALAVNAGVLAKIGSLLKVPMTFSVVPVAGQPGVLIPELAPYAHSKNTFHRILAGSFTDQDMVAALAANRRKTLIIAGFATEVAVLQSALSAMAAGYTAQIPVDVIGSAYSRTESAALRQMEQAGAIPTSVLSIAAFLAPNFSEEPGASVLKLFSELRTNK